MLGAAHRPGAGVGGWGDPPHLLPEPGVLPDLLAPSLWGRFADALDPAHAPDAALPTDWEGWVRALFGRYLRTPDGQDAGFAARHADVWAWAWALRPGSAPPALVALWPRGGGKSTTAELVCAACAARGWRPYALYVCSTQPRADDHVGNVAAMLESPAMEAHYPEAAARDLGKYGASKGWRRNRLRTRGRFKLDALGLDVAARGVKLDEDRPGLMVFDDLDEKHDSPAATARKLGTLTADLLGAGAADLAVLVIQNLVLPTGIMARLAGLDPDNAADFLANRTVSGPHPALLDADYAQATDPADGRRKWYVQGTPTWRGQDVPACQAQLHRMGLTAWRVEAQHEVELAAGTLFKEVEFDRVAQDALPPLGPAAVWVDPAVSNTDGSDCNGVVAGACTLEPKPRLVVLYAWEGRASPHDVLRRAHAACVRLGARRLGVETDQGGDVWHGAARDAWRSLVEDAAHPTVHAGLAMPRLVGAKAGATQLGKVERWQQLLPDYDAGRVLHLAGPHAVLERALRRVPERKPYDLVDAHYWLWKDTLGGGVARPGLVVVAQGSARGW